MPHVSFSSPLLPLCFLSISPPTVPSWPRSLQFFSEVGARRNGDCGSGDVQCNGGGLDFFDVSLVDGYNLPMLVTPLSSTSSSGSGKCAARGCVAYLNGACPADLRVAAAAAACWRACDAFGAKQYCCSGAYGNPSTCRTSAYSQFFKSACPRAYSYATTTPPSPKFFLNS